ncbi:hypothetical protein ACQP1G_00360 [Nocardia sp. CA-107356]|uniref:hypothetical protein n=1 Tax=Nocardia sp. CA-107356 TaxID=3239972 RepID=UPI003D93679D
MSNGSGLLAGRAGRRQGWRLPGLPRTIVLIVGAAVMVMTAAIVVAAWSVPVLTVDIGALQRNLV